MKIREMELLVRVADTGSMTVAAAQLGLTAAAVSAAVKRAEAALGVRLFERTTRALHLTEEGHRGVRGCAEVVDRWERVVDDARGRTTALQGTVHLSAPADTTHGVLAPLVAELTRAHGSLRVLFDTSDVGRGRHSDAIDLAIRYGPLADSSLKARRLVSLPTLCVAAPAYLAEAGTPERPEDLGEHRCLTLQRGHMTHDTWTLTGPSGTSTVEIEGCSRAMASSCGAGPSRASASPSRASSTSSTTSRVGPSCRCSPGPRAATFPFTRSSPAAASCRRGCVRSTPRSRRASPTARRAAGRGARAAVATDAAAPTAR